MNICLIGDNLTSLALAKILTNKNINIFLYYEKKKNFKLKSRTIGISKHNFDFIQSEIIKLNKNLIWKINKIEIFSEKILNQKLLNFEKKDRNLFLMIKNTKLYKLLDKKLNKNKLFKKILIKNQNSYEQIVKNKKYDLIINCDSNNKITKKYFYKKMKKNYDSKAYTTILKHKSLENKKAVQIFTKFGPLAFLPISKTETSVVFSITNSNKNLSQKEILCLIQKYNKDYEVMSFKKLENFRLNFSIPRNYFHDNIMLFGDSLHKIHPLAGQGFNMTLRDISAISKIIQNRIELGLKLDNSICKDFEDKNKNTNFIFAQGIDFIYEFFNLNRRIKNTHIDQLLKLLGKNKTITNIFLKKADMGLIT